MAPTKDLGLNGSDRFVYRETPAARSQEGMVRVLRAQEKLGLPVDKLQLKFLRDHPEIAALFPHIKLD